MATGSPVKWDWPPDDELRQMVEEFGPNETARRLGIDNSNPGASVRNRLKKRQRQPEPQPPAPDGELSAAEKAVRETIRQRSEKPPDPPPRPRRHKSPPKPKADEPSSAELNAALREFIAAWAVPIRMTTGCEWCTRQWLEDSPATARELVTLADRYPEFRRGLVWGYRMFESATLGAQIVKQVAKPIVHHGPLPEPAVVAGSVILAVPPRPDAAVRSHQHDAPSPPPPEPEPFDQDEPASPQAASASSVSGATSKRAETASAPQRTQRPAGARPTRPKTAPRTY